MADLLIDAGADINATDKDDFSPLFYAILEDNKQKAKLLIRKGADIKLAPSTRTTLLHVAVQREWITKSLVESLIQRGADIDAKDKDLKTTPLHHACSNMKATEVVKLLIAKGANVHSRSLEFRTPLHFAAEYGCIENARVLIENGADVNAEGIGGIPVMQEAAASKKSTQHVEFTHLLLEHGAHVLGQAYKSGKAAKEDGLKLMAEYMVTMYQENENGENADMTKYEEYFRQKTIEKIGHKLDADKKVGDKNATAAAKKKSKSRQSKTKSDTKPENGNSNAPVTPPGPVLGKHCKKKV